MFTTIKLQHFFIGFAVVTAFGVLVHDAKLDTAATIALALPFGLTVSLSHAPELRREGHTHVERAAFEKSAQKTNGIPPRTDTRKYLLSKHVKGFNVPDEHTMVFSPVSTVA